MRKLLTSLTALLAALTLIPFSGLAAAPAETAGESGFTIPDTAFTGEKTLRLIPTELPGNPGDDWIPVDLSPDGQTVLWKNDKSLMLTRSGKSIPVAFTAERGAGDPYGKGKRTTTILMPRIPAWEGLSWSADGRYAAISDLDLGLKFWSDPYTPDAQVLDTESSELYLVNSYNPNPLKGDAASVLLNRVDRNGRYLYYLAEEYQVQSSDGDNSPALFLRFCRCPVEGGEREILCETRFDDGNGYEIYYYDNLYETKDGSWMLSGYLKDPSGKGMQQLALVRFSPSGDQWMLEPISLQVPTRILYTYKSAWSAASGYGLFVLFGSTTIGEVFHNSESLENNIHSGMALHTTLLRIRPGEDMSRDVWYLMRSGENDNSVKVVSGDDFLYRLKTESGLTSPDDAQARSDEAAEAYENSPAKAYNLEIHQKALAEQTLLRPTCVSLSPDGYYALVNAGIDGQYRLYMISLRTMEIVPVEAPEGIGSSYLSSSILGKSYMPGITWNEDGTLLIRNSDYSDRTVVQAFRLITD